MAAFDVSPAVDALANECLATEGAAAVESLLALLQQEGISTVFRAHCDAVLISEQNRDCFGVSPVDVGENISDVCSIQWHDSLFKGVLTDVTGAKLAKCIAFNEQVIEGSQGKLAPVVRSKVQWKALRGNHTNCGHKAILHGAMHDDPELTNQAGRLDKAKVLAKCPALETVLTIGAPWIVVPSGLLEKYPGLESVIISTGNVMNNVAKAEHDLQILGRVAGKVRAGMSFDKIKESQMRSRSKALESLPHMYQFVRKFGGGPEMQLVLQSQTFIRGLSTDSRCVEPDLWDALANDYKGAEQAERFRHGLMSALFLEHARFMTKNDIAKAGSKDVLPNVLKLNKELEEFWCLLASSGVQNDARALAVFGNYQMAASCMLIGKKTQWLLNNIEAHQLMATHYDKDGRILPSHIGHWAVKEMFEDCGTKITPKYDHAAIKEKDDEETQEVIAGIRAAGDQTALMMKELGFAVDCCVRNAKNHNNKLYKITAYNHGEVTLKSLEENDSKDIKEKLEAFQNKEWTKDKSGPVEWLTIGTPNVEKLQASKDYRLTIAKSACMLAVNVVKDEQAGYELIKVQIGKKCIQASADIPKNNLLLAPMTTKIKIVDGAKELKEPVQEIYKPSELFIGNFKFDKKECRLFLAGIASSKADAKKAGVFSPFWGMEVTNDEAKANCVLTVMPKEKPLINVEDPASFKIPCIKNTAMIKRGSNLVLFVPGEDAGSAKKKAKKQ